MIDWFITNWIELVGALAGFIYIYLEIKEKPAMWPIGLITSVFYIAVFFDAGFYADMGLQFYYVFISIYGWYWWINGAKIKQKKILPISKIKLKLGLTLTLVTLLLFIAISYILINYTDSTVPYWDSFTTALSITATWMLARKIIEHWYIWILVNFVSMGLYIYKELYLTTFLFAAYFILSIVGFIQWNNNYKRALQSNE